MCIRLNQINVNPNPSVSEVVIESTDNIISVTIVDIQGNVVGIERNLNKASHTIDVQSLPAGQYILQIEDVNGLYGTKKFIRE